MQAPTGTKVAGDARRRVDLSEDGASRTLAVGLTTGAASAPGVTAVVFEDLDADGVRDTGEAGVAGWTVTLTGSGTVPAGTTGTDGSTRFADVPAGTWSAGLAARTGWRATTVLPVPVSVGSTAVEVALGVARITGLTVRPVDDVDSDGVRDEGELTIAGVHVEVAPAGGTPVRSTTGSDGVTADLAGKGATVRVLLPDTGLPVPCTSAKVVTPSGAASLTCTSDGALAVPADATELVVVGTFAKGVVTTSLFDDVDRDGKRGTAESPLADWPVALVAADGSEVARTTTDLEGVATAVVAPGSYKVVPASPASGVAWTSTGPIADVVVARARTAATVSGWVQPSSVSVAVFHDLDKDGVREEGDLPLSDRTVRLVSGTTTVTAYTDGSGRAAFPAKAGATYQVSVDLPTGWQATAPLNGTTAQTTTTITAPADGSPGVLAFGHWNTVDRTPPAAPTATPGSAALTGSALVTLSGESGATLRYTLDGTTPTATRGMSATSGATVRISLDRVLRAVAVDAAGNVSPVMAAAYDLPYTGKVGVLAPGSWAVTSGGTPRGGAPETATDDGRELAVGSVPVGTRPTVDITATVAVPTDLRAAQAVSVSFSHRATLRGTRVRAQWYDVSTSTWRALSTTTQGLDEARVDVDMTTIANWLDAAGTLKVRIIADNAAPFDLVVDRVAVTAVNRR